MLQHLPICEKSIKRLDFHSKSLCINLITLGKDMKNNLWCGRIVHRKTHSTQILRIMRLTVFFLLFIISETYALDGYSQNQKLR